MASTDLTRTHTVATADERKKHTFSAWVKLSSTGTIFANRPSNTYRFYYMILNNSHSYKNQFYCYMVYNGSDMLEARGTRKLRDINGWYHIVVRTDTTQATGSDRFRVYINGEQETLTFGHTPDQNEELQVNRDTVHYIGEEGNGNNQFDGSMSHIHFCDGYSYAPTEFGETDSTTGEWKIKTSPSVSYGTNGFFILKDGNSVTDQSGNSHNWAVNAGTLTKTEDNPSNVFATMNPLFHKAGAITFSNGNNTATAGSGSTSWTTRWGISSIGFSSGKFYAEAKISDYGSGQLYPIGIVRDENIPNIDSSIGSNGWGYYTLASGGGTIIGSEDGTNLQTSLGASTTGDIIGLAVDADNNTLQFYKNGSTLGSQVTGITAGTYFIGCNGYANFGIQMNFGNGYFGTTAVSSAGTNASGNGIFEYDVPTGYTALSTKGLNL